MYLVCFAQDQYIFIHDALLEFILSGGETEVKDTLLRQYLDDLCIPADNGITGLEKQYRVSAGNEVCYMHMKNKKLL